MDKIVHIAPMLSPLTSRPPGGAEQGLRLLAQTQAQLGLTVGIIAPSGSIVPPGAEFIDLDIPAGMITPMITSRVNTRTPMELMQMLEVERNIFTRVSDYCSANRNEIAVIHNHSYDHYPLFELNNLDIPITHSLQLPPLAPWINQSLQLIQKPSSHVSYISISQTSAEQYARVTGFQPRVIYYGLPMELIPFKSTPENYFIWVGRISPEKGLHSAIDVVCCDMQMSLVAIGPIYDKQYFLSEILPRLKNPLVNYRGHLPHADVLEAMSRARAFIFPLEWEEPFGLVIAESLATGTPVVAYRRGALPEIVTDGTTGFLLEQRDSFFDAIPATASLSRTICRDTVKSKFSIERFAADFFAEYSRISPQLANRYSGITAS